MSKSTRTVIVFAVLLVFVTVACSTGAATCPPQGSDSCDPRLPQVTTATGWWIDTTGKVSTETLRELNAESEAINKDGFQLAGLIVANAASDPSKIASDFGNLSGIGSANKDNGVVIVVLLDKEGNDGNKPYIFMAPGSGLSYLTATKLGQIRDQVFKPARAEGKWEQGLVDVVKTIHKIMLDPKAGEYLNAPPSTSGGLPWVWIVILLFVVLILVAGVLGGPGGSGGSSDSDSGFAGFGGSDSGLGGGGGFSGGGTGG